MTECQNTSITPKEIKVEKKTNTADLESQGKSCAEVDQGTNEKARLASASLWRKDFKISGSITEQGGGLSFVSLNRQIKAGLEKGHSESEIVEGVIRCISSGAKLRTYLEGKDLLTLTELRGILHSHFKEQTPTELYKKLCNATQGVSESAPDFVMRTLDIKQRVMAASTAEEEVPYDTILVEKMFIHAVATGLRDDNIRHRLRPTLKAGVSDVEILKTLNEITLSESEHQAKTKSSKVAAVKVDDSPALKGLQSQMDELKGHVLKLTQSFQNNQDKGQNKQPVPSEKPMKKMKKKCDVCTQNEQEKCNHCFKCGSEEHFARGCRSLNGRRSLIPGGQ